MVFWVITQKVDVQRDFFGFKGSMAFDSLGGVERVHKK